MEWLKKITPEFIVEELEFMIKENNLNFNKIEVK